MINWLKKHFIPHEGNNHQPHFLRTKNVRLLIVLVFVLEFGLIALPGLLPITLPVLDMAGRNLTASVLPGVLDDLTNQNRTAQHLSTLTVSPVLNRVAELKAQDMAQGQYFAHVSPDGKNPWYWFKLAGYKYQYAGENLAIDFSDSQDVAVAWMNSPTHRANILKNAYTEVGTGVATGTFEGHPTIYVAQVFGKPAQVYNTETTTSISTSTVVRTAVSSKVKATLATSVNPTKAAITIATSTVVGAISTTTTPTATAVVAPTVLGTSTAATTSTTLVAASTSIISTAVNADTITTGPQSNIFERYFTSPRQLVNIFLMIIAILVLLAIILKLSIRTDKKHPRLITNGLVILVIIFGIYVASDYYSKNKLETNTSFASFHDDQFDQ